MLAYCAPMGECGTDQMEASETPPVTFFLFAYQQEKVVREACEAALAQDYGNLEVVFSDDCSTDATFAIMEDVAAAYRGPHRVRLNRNVRNLGLIGHVNRAMEISTGELIVAAAGDDISVPLRTRKLVETYLATGRRANSVHSAVEAMDMRGNRLGVRTPPIRAVLEADSELVLRHALIIGATHAWTRRVFEVFGPIRCSGTYEDLAIVYRSSLIGQIAYVDQPLVRYRVGEGLTTKTRTESWRTHGLRRRSLRLSTLEQRRADLEVLGRPVPRRLHTAMAFERMAKNFYHGDLVLMGLELLRRPVLVVMAVRRITWALALSLRSRVRALVHSGSARG